MVCCTKNLTSGRLLPYLRDNLIPTMFGDPSFGPNYTIPLSSPIQYTVVLGLLQSRAPAVCMPQDIDRLSAHTQERF